MSINDMLNQLDAVPDPTDKNNINIKSCFDPKNNTVAQASFVLNTLMATLDANDWDSLIKTLVRSNYSKNQIQNVFKTRGYIISCARVKWVPDFNSTPSGTIDPRRLSKEVGSSLIPTPNLTINPLGGWPSETPNLDYPVKSMADAQNARLYLSKIFPDYSVKLKFEIVGPFEDTMKLLKSSTDLMYAQMDTHKICDLNSLQRGSTAKHPLLNIGESFTSLIGSLSWQNFQIAIRNLKEIKEDERNFISYYTQAARFAIARCTNENFNFIVTGSSRNLKVERNSPFETALQDIDASGPSKNIKNAAAFMKKIVPTYVHTLEFELLVDPLEALFCKQHQIKDDFESCEKTISQISVEVMLQYARNSEKEKGFQSFFVESKEFCPQEFQFSKNTKGQFIAPLILLANSQLDFQNIVKTLKSNTNESKYLTTEAMTHMKTAVTNPAYYLTQDAMVKWVVEREVFLAQQLNQKFPMYLNNERAKRFRRSAATLEQFIKGFHYVSYQTPAQNQSATAKRVPSQGTQIKDWYYFYKYILRGLAHILLENANGGVWVDDLNIIQGLNSLRTNTTQGGFDAKQAYITFKNLHALTKSERPKSQNEFIQELKRLANTAESLRMPILDSSERNIQLAVLRGEWVSNMALKLFLDAEKEDAQSIWNAVCPSASSRQP